MSLLSVIVLVGVLHLASTTACPPTYNSIVNGCYKMNNGTLLTWDDARQYCINDSNVISTNKTGYVTHLVAFETAVESTAVVYWMKAWGINSQFWTDGVAASSSWDWSKQALSWYFNASDQLIVGNGSHYRIVYNAAVTTYQVVDEPTNRVSNFICEYQNRCSPNNTCKNNATCYLNVGRDLCACAPGYTGTVCDQEIDECLSSPCLHGGVCTDRLNNYTCDCSSIFFQGPNCETPKEDSTQSQRSAAFWSVFGVVCGLVALLTLSDLPWDEIAATVGCPWFRFKCCFRDDDDDDDEQNPGSSSDSSPRARAAASKQVSLPGTVVRGVNYHVMNTVWNPDQLQGDSPTQAQYNGYVTPDPKTTPSNALIQSFAAVVVAKQRQEAMGENRVYAVDILPQSDAPVTPKRPVDTMISWTHQLQEQLKNKSTRPTSSDSTRELVHAESKDDN